MSREVAWKDLDLFRGSYIIMLEKSHRIKIVESTYAVMEIHVYRSDAFQVRSLGFMSSLFCKMTGLYVCDKCQILRTKKGDKTSYDWRRLDLPSEIFRTA